MIPERYTNCPSHIDLRGFSIGNVADTEFEEIANHVTECQRCGIKVDEAARLHEFGLVAELRSLAGHSSNSCIENLDRDPISPNRF